MPDRDLASVNAHLIECRRCPRLVEWRESVAVRKKAAYRGDEYWGRPVPGFGDPRAELLVVGLAPAAHGANRTGRMFTGDRSGEWLYRALFKVGFASQKESLGDGDGLTLTGAYVTSAVHCAPPGNRPTTEERDNCSSWFDLELRLQTDARVVVCLGAFAFQSAAAAYRRIGHPVVAPRPAFGHGVEVRTEGGPVLLASYHPSQQNTFTGKLTQPMFDAVFARARGLVNSP